MNDDEKIDRLRHAKYMHIDKASETIAAQHCCSIHYHRSLVLEGVRRAALRNIGSPNGEVSQSIVDAGAVRLFSRKYNESVEVVEEDLNRICGDMFAIFMNSLWDVYLCLLYEELQAYRRLIKRNSGFGYAPLSAFMDANGDLLAHLPVGASACWRICGNSGTGSSIPRAARRRRMRSTACFHRWTERINRSPNS